MTFIAAPCEFCGTDSYFPCQSQALASECDNNAENIRSEAKADLGKMLYDQLESSDLNYKRRWDQLSVGEQDFYIHTIVSVLELGQDKLAKAVDLDEIYGWRV